MNFYYLDKKIVSKSLKRVVNDALFSNIRLGKQSLEDRFSEMLSMKMQKILDIEEIQLDDEQQFIVCTSNLTFLDKKLANSFFMMLKSSAIEYIYESNNGFIFKGTKKSLLAFINNNKNENTYTNNHVFEIENIFDLKKIIASNFHSRYFNSILKKDERIIKKSTQKSKLESEYLFLKSIPDNLKPFYAEVITGKDLGLKYEYSIQAYDMFDTAYQFINSSIDADDLNNLFIVLKAYFDQVIMSKVDSNGKETKEIINKNKERFAELKTSELFPSLDSFLLNHAGISISDHYSRVESSLRDNESNINSKGRVFSHGDLCFSNILFSPSDLEIKLIDPRGLDSSKGFRSPYYDMAKLSHSLLGDYDFIINNMSNINFNDDMSCSNKLIVEKNHIFDSQFKSFLENFDMQFKVVRLIESSLFLSMLPLHIENTKKVFSLALKSVEVFQDIYE